MLRCPLLAWRRAPLWPPLAAISHSATCLNLFSKRGLGAHSLLWQWGWHRCQLPLRGRDSPLGRTPSSQKCTSRPRRRQTSGSLPNRKWRSPEFLPGCCVSRVMTGGAWAWITSYLLFPFFNFGHFALFHLFGLLLLLRFEGVGVREKAVEGREGNGVALSFVILVWKKKRNKDVICIEAHNVIAHTPARGFQSWRPFSWAWTTPHGQQSTKYIDGRHLAWLLADHHCVNIWQNNITYWQTSI